MKSAISSLIQTIRHFVASDSSKVNECRYLIILFLFIVNIDSCTGKRVPTEWMNFFK